MTGRLSAVAGARNAALAEQALTVLDALGVTVPPLHAAVARARIANPSASWAQLAAGLGMSKSQAAGLFRRLITTAGLTGADHA
jgi:hypothetical protein